MSKPFGRALVVGAGAFGTSIASALANNFEEVYLKVRSDDVYQSLKSGRNEVYLPGHELASNIKGEKDWEAIDEKVDKFDLIVSGLPTAGIKTFFTNNHERFEKYLDGNTPFVSLSKGIDPVTLELPDDLFFDLFPKQKDNFTFLSGPSFAKEIMDHQITLVTVAGRSRPVLVKVAAMFDCAYFKVFPSYDVKGVLLGGALKNVIAIAGGVIEGLGFNHNTRAAMITRGIAEMLRFGRVYNARPETFYGLSGMGDLILTTTGGLSRNKTFGLEIAKGRSPREILDSQRTVVEGFKTAKAAKLVCDKYEISARIFNGVYQVLHNDHNPKEVIYGLMKVPAKFELE